jgi:hypothetical protein
MNTLYVLKGGMKFKFLALTVVVLLGLGVGNTAWGQIACTSGNWNDSGVWKTGTDCASGTATTAPNQGEAYIIETGVVVTAGDISHNAAEEIRGSLIANSYTKSNWGTGLNISSTGSVTILNDATIDKLIVADGGQIKIGGSVSILSPSEISGLVIIDGNCIANNQLLTINETGVLVVKGNFSGDGTIIVNGQLLINGDFTSVSGGDLTIGSSGFMGVGGNFYRGNTTNVNGRLTVLGDFTTTNNLYLGASGGFSVIGKYTVPEGWATGTICDNCELLENCCTVEGVNGVVTADDPIWDIEIGLNTVYFNDIDIVGNGELNDQVIWTYGPISANCKNRIKVSYFMTISGTGDAVLQYSENGVDWSTGNPIKKNPAIDRYFWEGSDGNGVPIGTGTIFLRILVRSLDAGSTVTFDKILVDAFNEGGVGSTPIKWVTAPDVDVCANQLAVYEIENISDYTDIRWNYPDEGNVEIVSISPNKARCEVKWKNSPGVLKVTAIGGSCGGESASVTYTINVNQPTSFSAFYEKTDISCPTAPDNGSITLRSCGGTGTVSYQWETGPDGYAFANFAAQTISNLPEGTYTATVYLNQGQPNEESQSLTIEIKRPVLVDITFDPSTLNTFLCPTDLTAGHFEIIATGGTPPYDITVTKDGLDITNSDNSLVYSNLDVGAYVVSVNDKNSCGVRTFPLSIVEDIVAPTFTNFPANVQMTMAEYQANTGSKLTTTTSNLTGGTLSAPSALTSILALPSLSGLHNLKLAFTVSQSPVSINDADVFYVEMTTDGSNWNSILTDQNSLNNGTVTIPLGENADGNTNLGIRFTATIATTGLTYTVSNVQISGSRFAVSPPTCSDNSLVCSVSYIDSEPQWSSCTGYSNANAEFHVVRTWTAVDACGNSTPRTQYLSVGTAPKFTAGSFPENETLDFCNNTPTIQSPTATDGCGTATVSWVAKNSSNEVIGSGDNTDLSGVTFPADPAGNTDLEYTVTWTATDEAHMTLSQDQTITIKPAIAATITAPNLDNVCKDENVVFTVTPRGGTGTFNGTSFTPAGGTWNGTTYIFTTSLANVKTAETVTVRIQDIAVAGVDGVCNQDVLSPEFDVHDLIPTGGISRE